MSATAARGANQRTTTAPGQHQPCRRRASLTSTCSWPLVSRTPTSTRGASCGPPSATVNAVAWRHSKRGSASSRPQHRPGLCGCAPCSGTPMSPSASRACLQTPPQHPPAWSCGHKPSRAQRDLATRQRPAGCAKPVQCPPRACAEPPGPAVETSTQEMPCLHTRRKPSRQQAQRTASGLLPAATGSHTFPCARTMAAAPNQPCRVQEQQATARACRRLALGAARSHTASTSMRASGC